MSAAIAPQTSSMSNGSFSNNTAELLYLVALFVGKGEVNTANALLRSLQA